MVTDSFLQSLRDTVEWCSHQARKKLHFYWSQVLRPQEWPIEYKGKDLESRFSSAVDSVIQARRSALADVELGDMPSIAEVCAGSFVLYAPSMSLACGAARVASMDFFDDENTPAWACWVAWIRNDELPEELANWGPGYLLSWCPSHVLEHAREGIRVNPEVCIVEARDVRSKFIDELREEGLISNHSSS